MAVRVLLVGGGAREHAIAEALDRDGAQLLIASSNANPGLERLALSSFRANPTVPGPLVEFARAGRADFAVIGPEDPLGAGVSDALVAAGVPVMGPSKRAAQLETSKRFCRELLARQGVGGLPKFVAVADSMEAEAQIRKFAGPFVIKANGLAQGKGVGVFGKDFSNADEAVAFANRLLASPAGHDGLLLEERLEGEEFSLMAFVTDSGLYPMPAVQDYKRALEGDAGPNTGGMGSYSQRDHLLPFLSAADRDRAVAILQGAVAALRKEGTPYRGVLYGGFMLTAHGPVLLEFNVRFGDPEALNVLPLYEPGDSVELLFGVATGAINPNLVRFRLRATVAKYLVPRGYPTQPAAGTRLSVDEPSIAATGVHVYYGSVEASGATEMRFTTSRGVALVGEASAIWEAGQRVESALKFVEGEYAIRHDIGTKEDLSRRWEHMRQLLAPGTKPSPIPLSVLPPSAPPSSVGEPTPVF